MNKMFQTIKEITESEGRLTRQLEDFINENITKFTEKYGIHATLSLDDCDWGYSYIGFSNEVYDEKLEKYVFNKETYTAFDISPFRKKGQTHPFERVLELHKRGSAEFKKYYEETLVNEFNELNDKYDGSLSHDEARSLYNIENSDWMDFCELKSFLDSGRHLIKVKQISIEDFTELYNIIVDILEIKPEE